MNQEPVIVERRIDVPASRIWRALTDEDEMRKWYFDLPGFKAEEGYEFQFLGGKADKQFLHLCKVTSVVPERKLSYTWRYEGYPGDSEVTFELMPEGKHTLVRITHTGLDTLPQNEDFAKENFVAGWNSIILQLDKATAMAKITKETFIVEGKNLLNKIKELIKEGNIRKITITEKNGHELMSFPLNMGIVGVAIAPVLAAVGAIAALLTECTISVEREEKE